MQELILRDHLAIDRTHLANERTFLAYARSALACLVGGVTLQKLFPDDLSMQYLAWGLLVLGPVIGLLGIWLSWRMHRKIKAYYQQPKG